MKNTLLITALLLLTVSCDKEKVCNEIPTGNYKAVFTTKNYNTIDDPEMVISLVDESSIVINGYEFERSGCEVSGQFSEMVMFAHKGPVFIRGEIKKKNKKHVISGNFYLTDAPEENPMYGTFTIEAD